MPCAYPVLQACRHSTNPAQRQAAVLPHGSAQAHSSATLRCVPKALFSLSAALSGVLCRGVALPCCLFLHASRVPSPQQWGSGLLKAHAHEHCEANSQPFPHCERHKPTNCNKTQKGQKIKGQMGHAGLICTEFPCSVHGCNPIKLVPAHVLGFATCLFLESSPPSYKKQTEKSLPISLICVTHNDTVHKAHPGIGTMH